MKNSTRKGHLPYISDEVKVQHTLCIETEHQSDQCFKGIHLVLSNQITLTNSSWLWRQEDKKFDKQVQEYLNIDCPISVVLELIIKTLIRETSFKTWKIGFWFK